MKLIRRCAALMISCAPLSTILTCICYLVTFAFPVALTYSISGIVDLAASAQPAEACTPYLAGLFISFAVVSLARIILSITLNAGVFEKSNAYCRLCIAKKAAELDLIEYENAETLNCRSGALNCVENETLPMFFMLFVKGLSGIFSLLAMSVLLWSYHPVLVIAAVISVLPFFIVRAVRGKVMLRLRRIQIPEMRRVHYLYSLFADPVTAREIRLFETGEYLVGKWKNSFSALQNQLLSAQNKDTKLLMACEGVTVCFFAAAVVFSTCLTLKGILSPGIFGGCLFAFLSMQSVTKDLFDHFGAIPQLFGNIQNYYNFLDIKNASLPAEQSSIQLNRRMEMSQVSFSYPNAKTPALEQINVTIEKGETVAIVGENGSGKTTLSKLLIGMYRPAAGVVSWDGVDLRTVTTSALAGQVTIVTQKPARLKLPLAESVALQDKPGRSSEEIREILRQAGLPQLAESPSLLLQLGREFGGDGLSGGEWQKLALARCIYKDAPVCILDEPTSALDPTTEVSILKNFINISKEKTSVIITHRIGICRYADKIIVLKKGKIVQEGTHEQLVNVSGEYRTMYQEQCQWYG